MMVMQQMRENTKWIMLITALAFVGLMVFEWGMDLTGRSASNLTGGEIGTVNGQSVSYAEFTETYRTLYQQRQQQDQGSISSLENERIEEQAWEQVVMDRLVEQEMRRRGIRVTDAEIRQAARYSPPPELYSYEGFQTNGQFDLSKYHQFLASSSADPQLMQDLENYYRRVLPRTKLFQQVAAGIVVTDGELWRMYRERNETASVRFVALSPNRLVPDAEVTVGEREIASYYSQHRSEFERPARAEVRLVAIDQRPTAADTAAVLERAREIRQQIVGGAEFAELARRESEDEGTAEQGGDLGTVQRGQTVPEFEQAVWNARIGSVTEPVLTRYGYHLIRVDRRTDQEADVRHILLPLRRTMESEDAMLEQVDSLEQLVENVSLESAADTLGLTVRTVELNPVLPTIPGVGSVEEGTDWVFEDRPLIGEVSPVFENESRYYVMELVEREESRALTLEEARPTIREILMSQKKRARAQEIGRSVVERLEAGATLEEASSAANLQVRQAGPFTRLDFVPGIGGANAAIGAAFGLEVGETSGLLSTSDGFYIIQVTDRTPADRAAWEAQKGAQRQQVLAALQNQRISQFMDALREEARVVDRRDEVLQAAGTQTAG